MRTRSSTVYVAQPNAGKQPMMSDTPPRWSYASAYRTLTRPGSVLLGSLRRLVFPGRPFTKPWASNLLDEAVEVAARGHRHDQRLALLGGDHLLRTVPLFLVGHSARVAP
jgi:hypothetical protein